MEYLEVYTLCMHFQMWNVDFVWFGGQFLNVQSRFDMGIWNESTVEILAKNTGELDQKMVGATYAWLELSHHIMSS